MRSVVSEKGQVTIPKALRDRLGLRPGTTIEFQIHKGWLVVKKQDPSGDDPIEAVTGVIDRPRSVDEYLDEVRGKGE